MTTVIQISNLSKIYRLGQIGTGTITSDLERWYKMKIRGQEDPFLKIGETNERNKKGISDVVYSLRDINFEVQQGEALGIIGKNGAGKSTLLKILSRVTSPTTGKIHIKGRVASLLEVGTGFHPELTGRENIYLNGAILGMRKKEITRKLDEIIGFSGVERYIDTPVKRYSSGMYVRLAFAVAAHLESEIMIVDEVLAVGDAEFQQKCLGKMGEVSKGEGRTILFVSHNMNAIKTLCKSGIYLKDGCIEYSGTSNSVIDHYLSDSRTTQECVPYTNPEGNETAYLKFATCINKKGAEEFIFSADDEITIRLNIIKKSKIRGIYGHLLIKSADESIIFETDTLEQPFNHLDTSETGEFDSVIIIPSRILRTGTYYVSLGLASSQENIFQIESLNSFLKFEVIAEKTQRDLKRMALTSTILKWENTLQKGQP